LIFVGLEIYYILTSKKGKPNNSIGASFTFPVAVVVLYATETTPSCYQSQKSLSLLVSKESESAFMRMDDIFWTKGTSMLLCGEDISPRHSVLFVP